MFGNKNRYKVHTREFKKKKCHDKFLYSLGSIKLRNFLGLKTKLNHDEEYSLNYHLLLLLENGYRRSRDSFQKLFSLDSKSTSKKVNKILGLTMRGEEQVTSLGTPT